MQDVLNTVKSLIPFVALLVGSYILVLWIATLIWTYRDIHSRTEDFVLQALAVALVFVFNFAGWALYLILRPRDTLVQRYERELEEEYMRRDIEDTHVCPTCQRGIEADFILCPYCQTSLRHQCLNCARVIDLTWPVCPFCATPAGTRPSQPLYQRETEVLMS